MPEINEYRFSHRELLETLVKRAGIREGRWQLSVNFDLKAGNIGIGSIEPNPAAIVSITSIGLARATAEVPPNLVWDATTTIPVFCNFHTEGNA